MVEKLRIVVASQSPSASVVDVARRHDVHPNLLTVGGGRRERVT